VEVAVKSLFVFSFGALVLLASPVAAKGTADADQAARAIARQTIQLQDRDHDGRISLKESAGAALSMFYSIDTDQSQLISSAEMVHATMTDVAALKVSNSADQTAALVASRFEVMDMDGDGSISLPEMLAVMQTVFDTADANADGFVSQNELVALATDRSAVAQGR
jgi:Ca2+-binding EF-hand superfamily protein